MACKVLVVDDDQRTREALVEILRRAGYEVTSLASGDGLEDLLVRNEFAAAIIDYHLPSRNGLEIAQILRKNLPTCRIVLISSEYQPRQHVLRPAGCSRSIPGQTLLQNGPFEYFAGIVSGAEPHPWLTHGNNALTASLLQQVLAFIRSHELIKPHDRILVGVSGGPDSTALLHLLHRSAHIWPITLGVAHFDHTLRGAASRADALWVADLAASLNLPCYLGTDDVRRHKQEKKISLQTAARQMRLKFFQEVKAEAPLPYRGPGPYRR